MHAGNDAAFGEQKQRVAERRGLEIVGPYDRRRGGDDDRQTVRKRLQTLVLGRHLRMCIRKMPVERIEGIALTGGFMRLVADRAERTGDDDLLDAGIACCAENRTGGQDIGAEHFSLVAVRRREPAGAMINALAALHGRGGDRRVRQVADHDIDIEIIHGVTLAVAEERRPHQMSVAMQPADQVVAQVSGRPGYENHVSRADRLVILQEIRDNAERASPPRRARRAESSCDTAGSSACSAD